MITMADKYKGRFSGTLADVPPMSDKVLSRRGEIKKIFAEDENAILDDRLQSEMMLISFIRSANIMKSKLGDNIDDENQNTKAFQCMDIITGLAQELGIDLEDYIGEH